ncbi:hypothetical protein C3L33_18250, partial [Rhododendron williamsianum]
MSTIVAASIIFLNCFARRLSLQETISVHVGDVRSRVSDGLPQKSPDVELGLGLELQAAPLDLCLIDTT